MTLILFIIGLYNVYFIPRINSAKNDMDTYLEKLVKNDGKNFSFNKISHLFNEIDSLSFLTTYEADKIKKSLNELDKTPGNTSIIFRTIKEIENFKNDAFLKETKVFMIVMVLAVFFSIFSIFFLYCSLKKHVFREIDVVSTGLSEFNLSHVLKPMRSSYVETENLAKGFNSMARRMELYRLVLNAGNSTTMHEFIKELFNGLKKFFKVNRVAIADVEEDKLMVNVVLSDSPKLIVNEGFIHQVDTACLNELKTKRALVVNDIGTYLRKHPNSYMNFIYDEDMRSAVMLPLYVESRCVGILFLNSFQKNAFEDGDIKDLKVVPEILGNIYKNISTIQNLILSTVIGFTKLVEKKDEETGDHLIRMGLYSRVIAQEMAKNPIFFEIMGSKFIEQIYKQAPLHDIGKVGVPDYILQKPGKLSDDEFEVMKIHTITGYEILNSISSKSQEDFFEVGRKIARFHHERWDGKGYPDGLMGKNIPLCARIVAVADVFDALTIKRPYKVAFDYNRSVSIIIKESGTHFDPEVVNAFIKAQSVIKNLYKSFHT